MKLTIELTKPFTDAVGAKEIDYDFQGNRMEELLSSLSSQYPRLHNMFFSATGSITEYLIVFVNGKPISSLKGPDTELIDGDRLLFLFPVSGG